MSIGARLDGQQVAAALSRDGFDAESILVQSAELGVVGEALLRPAQGDPDAVLIYYSGPIVVGADGGVVLASGASTPGVPLADIAIGLGETHPIIIAIEDCFAMDGAAGALAGARMSDLGPSITVMTSAGPGGQCTTGTQRLTDRLASGNPGRGADTWVMRPGSGGGVVVPPNLGVWSALALGPDAPTLAALRAAPGRAASDADFRLVRYDPSDPTPIFEWGADGVRAPGAGNGAQALLIPRQLKDPIIEPVPAGKPQPSILIGLLPEEAENADSAEPSALYADRPTRDALRRRDPETFGLLLAAGSLDPPQEPSLARDELLRRRQSYFAARVDSAGFDPVGRLLAFSLQAELQDMKCYTSGLDGAWGNGSRAAAGRYFQARQVNGRDPGVSLPLWRDVISNDAVTCAVAQVRRQTTPTRTNRSNATTNRTASQPRRQQQPARRTEPRAPAASSKPVVIPFN